MPQTLYSIQEQLVEQRIIPLSGSDDKMREDKRECRNQPATHLFVEFIIGHQIDVLHSWRIGHGDGGTTRFQFNHSVLPVGMLNDGEIQLQITHITLIGLQQT